MFDFFTDQRLSSRDFNSAETQWAYKGLLAKQAITTIYAKSGTGKSYLALAVASRIVADMRLVCYVDYENRVAELEKRGVRRISEARGQFCYLHRSKIKIKRHELIAEMAKLAKDGYYKDALIILDGAKHFVRDVEIDRQTREMMSMLIDMRDDGATILIIHHTNKSGRNYQGSKELIDGSDNVFFAAAAPVPDGYVGLCLGVEKMRDAIAEQNWRIDTQTLELDALPLSIAQMSESAKETAQSIIKAIPSEGISQRKLCEAIGRDPVDKTVIALLKQYAGALWAVKESQKRGQSASYYPLGKGNTSLNAEAA
jgi:hypothetical protein